MKKRSAEDDEFLAKFAPELRRKYDDAKRRGVSDQSFAESIGVERASLDRYLDGKSMPSVRTVAFAFEQYKVAIPYKRIALEQALPQEARRRKARIAAQMVLPFTIETEKAASRVDLKLKPISARKFSVELTIQEVG